MFVSIATLFFINYFFSFFIFNIEHVFNHVTSATFRACYSILGRLGCSYSEVFENKIKIKKVIKFYFSFYPLYD